MGAPARVDPRVEAALNRSIELGEIGISVAVYHRGELIVNAVAGLADRESKKPADLNTLWAPFSVTKGVTSLAVHIQAERGHLDLKAPISKYWPEFAAHGKKSVTVQEALCMRTGIPQMPEGVTPELLADWKWMVERVADLEPIFPPGTTNAYHVLVWGWILGEIVVRTDPKKRTFEAFTYEEICEPLGVTDYFLGVPDADLSRVAKLYGGDKMFMADEHHTSPVEVFPGSSVHNLKAMQQAVDPGAGALTTAKAVATIFAAIAEGGKFNGVRLLSKERIDSLSRVRPEGQDKILPIPVHFSLGGYWVGGKEGVSDPFVGDHDQVIYSPGAGGSIAWADWRNRISIAICHNNMDTAAIVSPARTFEPIVQAIRDIISERN